MLTIAIIGCGLSGTSLFCQLVERFHCHSASGKLDPDSIRVIVFEKGSLMGPGMPHNAEFVQPYHITNMCAEHMSIFHDRPGDFQTWMVQNRDELESRYPALCAELIGFTGLRTTCNHYPRALMGAYLSHRFNSYVERGRELGMQIDPLANAEVSDIQEKRNHVSILVGNLANGSAQEFPVDRAVIATGHWLNKTRGAGYFPSPWPADRLLQNIPTGSRVAIIGTSLSAIETALTLTADGHFVHEADQTLAYQHPQHPRKPALFSRNGLLPSVRGRIGTYRNRVLTPQKLTDLRNQKTAQFNLDTLFELFNAELLQAYGQPFDWRTHLDTRIPPAERLARSIATARHGDGPEGDVIWQTVLHQLLPFVRDLYLGLSIGERKRFEKQFKTPFFVFAAPQPIINAQKLLALIKADSVHIHRLAKTHRWPQGDHTRAYTVDYIDGLGKQRRESYPYVVDARGQQVSWRDNPSILARNLLRTGVVQTTEIRVERDDAGDGGDGTGSPETYNVGSVCINPETHAVIQVDPYGNFHPSHRIFALGAMTRGQIIDTSMAQSLAESANRIVSQVLIAIRDYS